MRGKLERRAKAEKPGTHLPRRHKFAILLVGVIEFRLARIVGCFSGDAAEIIVILIKLQS
jgi:hypothetical protein